MSEGFYPPTSSVSLIEPKLKAKAYRKQLYAFFDVFFFDKYPVKSEVASYAAGDLMIATTKSSPAHYIRDEFVVERSNVSSFTSIQYIMKGAIRADFGHKTADLSSGDIFIIDLSMNCELWVEDCECIHFLIPRSYLHNIVRSVHGRTISKGFLVARMLGEHLMRCAELLRNGDFDEAPQAMHLGVDLMTQCLIDSSSSKVTSESQDVLRQNILEYIDEHLVHPDLDTCLIITKFGISRPKLYRFFAEFGGVQHFIRDKRLDAALRDICQQPMLSISETARRYGFSNDRQFQRAFRSRFSITARDARMGWGIKRLNHRRRS
ncbi:helix-turn-helix domain-containing protein [Rhodanobacter sp. Si-c]|uniref:Helix-turn-helix domain-containing protein n=1 Tax=Rhodanobacter lycopersici TaxID=3162487 RepID=A0ABV3QJ04_9GAMM